MTITIPEFWAGFIAGGLSMILALVAFGWWRAHKAKDAAG